MTANFFILILLDWRYKPIPAVPKTLEIYYILK
jgi:hypothetical protein